MSALPTARTAAIAFLGDGKTVFRGGWGIGYDVIFYNLLTVATNPNVNTLIQNNILDLYPNKLDGQQHAGVQPAERLDEHAGEPGEPGEPLLQPHHAA